MTVEGSRTTFIALGHWIILKSCALARLTFLFGWIYVYIEKKESWSFIKSYTLHRKERIWLPISLFSRDTLVTHPSKWTVNVVRVLCVYSFGLWFLLCREPWAHLCDRGRRHWRVSYENCRVTRLWPPINGKSNGTERSWIYILHSCPIFHWEIE